MSSNPTIQMNKVEAVDPYQGSNDDDEKNIWLSNIRVKRNAPLNPHGISNAINTTKYSIITWLPKSLWEQFRRVANVYFLGISVLMLIGTYATYLFTTPLEPFSTVMTLIFVLMVTSVKEGLEDLDRARSDNIENTRKACVVTFDERGEPQENIVETQFIKSGDIVKMTGTTQVPVDLLLIASSMWADGNQCYVETANIDGETNLKLKEAPSGLLTIIQGLNGEPTVDLLDGAQVEFEPANKNIHNFIGALHLRDREPISLSTENLILRSSLFSNTDWGYGIAIYTGQETKIQMNNRHAPSKMSKIEGYVNKAIVLIFFSQCCLVTAAVISLFALEYNVEGNFPYVYPPNEERTSVLPVFIEQWFIFFILFNNFIPISLYVTIELVNLGQAYLISVDKHLYDEALDMPCVVRSSNLSQELGLVKNIFSDKTGTLTRNEMKFVKCIVDGVMYDVGPNSNMASELKAMKNMEDSLLYAFLLCLTTCHTVIREKNGTYRAESPDELALVEGVGHFQCTLQERGTMQMNIEMLGQKQVYDVLAVNAFNADRKRMSIILRNNITNQYFLMCKGADNIMLPLCAMKKSALQNVEKALLDLACLGLRTLCVSRKVLTKEYAEKWIQSWKDASNSLQDRSGRLAHVAAEIEQDMELLGITAIEDRLQDQVPEVIADLAKAGIVLWMLTGDKEETAIQIGHSCNLLRDGTKEFYLTKIFNAEDYEVRLKQVHDDIEQICLERKVPGALYQELALVMDGPSFKFFKERDEVHRKLLLEIGQACRSVIACRLTPVQKQQLVNIVKMDTKPKATTLSIGDGANDVSMIREADVGVGIFGKEGRQAANNADFAIGQFKFLKRLLLVHGRWNYGRQSRVFLYSMHKNMVITLTLFWFSYLAAVSGTSMYESWVYSLYNFALGLPIIFYGIMDRDVPEEFALEFPQVYSTGLNNTILNMRGVGLWIWNAVLFAVVFCLFFFMALKPSYHDYSLYEMGTMVYVALVLSLQLKVLFIHNLYNWIHVTAMFISLGGLFLVLVILSNDTEYSYDLYYVAQKLYGDGFFWFFGVFSIPLFMFLIDIVGQSAYVFVFPTEQLHFREASREYEDGIREYPSKRNSVNP